MVDPTALPTLAELAGDPHPHLARLRATGPVSHVPALGGYLVTGRTTAVDVLRDAATFTVDDPRFSTAQVVGSSMLSLDGPAHDRHRRPFVGPFRPRRVTQRFGRSLQDLVTRGIDDVVGAPGPTAELRATIAGPVAAGVVAHSLGLDGDDDATVARLLGWYREIVASVSGIAEGRTVTAAGAAAMAELGASLRPHLDVHPPRARTGAAPTLADSLLRDAAVNGDLDGEEVIANAAVIMFGGIETTEAMILNALWFILRADGARPVAEVAGVAAAVEESLRLEPAAAVVDRFATADVTIGDVRIPNRSLVEVSLAGANRDPTEFPDPDRFDPSRPNLRRQLAFAVGPHVCIGMDLARLETCVAVASLLERLPGLRLADDRPAPSGLVFRKPERLDVTWDR